MGRPTWTGEIGETSNKQARGPGHHLGVRSLHLHSNSHRLLHKQHRTCSVSCCSDLSLDPTNPSKYEDSSTYDIKGATGHPSLISNELEL